MKTLHDPKYLNLENYGIIVQEGHAGFRINS